MRNKRIMLCSLICVTAVAFSYALAETTEDLQKKYNNSQTNIKENKKQLENVKSEQKDILTQVQELDSKVEIIQVEINKLNSKIEGYEKVIEEKNKEIVVITQKLEEQKEELKTKLRLMYEMGDQQFIYLLLESKDPFEFLSRYAVVEQIMEYDNKIIDGFINTKNALDEAKRVLEQSKLEVENARQAQLESKEELDNKIKEKQTYMNLLESKEDTLEAMINKEEQEANRLVSQIKNLQSNTKVYVGGKFLWPTTGTTITSYFGKRLHPVLKVYKGHAGIDIGVPTGENIYAANSGKIIYSGVNGGYGKCVMVDHGGGIVTLYGHASKLLVSVGEEVSTGDVIAKIGSTGISTGPHLHFEVRENGTCVDPLLYLR